MWRIQKFYKICLFFLIIYPSVQKKNQSYLITFRLSTPENSLSNLRENNQKSYFNLGLLGEGCLFFPSRLEGNLICSVISFFQIPTDWLSLTSFSYIVQTDRAETFYINVFTCICSCFPKERNEKVRNHRWKPHLMWIALTCL